MTDEAATLKIKVRDELRALDKVFQHGLVVSHYEKKDKVVERAVREFHNLVSHLFTAVWQETNVTGLKSLERYEIIRQVFDTPALPDYVREITSPYSNNFALSGVGATDEHALITFQQKAQTVREREAVTEWVQIDADTKRRQPKLDENQQPIYRDAKPKEEILDITYKVKLDFFVNLLIETGRTSLVHPVPDDYIPAPLGTDFSVLLKLFMGQATGVHMDMPPRGPFMRRGRGRPEGGFVGPADMMWDYPPPWAFMRPPEPCRVFLKPDDKGRFEVIFEPYSQRELDENRRMISKATAWAEWRVESAPSVSMLTSRLKEAVDAALAAKKAEPA